MAHAATISNLAEGLVRSVTGQATEGALFRQLRDQTVKGLRNQTHARTNQFEVKSKLDGLIEKFAVRDRDDLSEALLARLEELATESTWMPEILSLLLQLSDRPLEKTLLQDVEALSYAKDGEATSLTWHDIIAADPLDEESIWDDVEHGYHSSGDDATVAGDSGETISTEATSVGEDDVVALASLHIVHAEANVLDEVNAAQKLLLADDEPVSISALTLMRETLLMLHGLPTNVYSNDESTGRVSLKQTYMLETATRTVMRDLLVHCASIGSVINELRAWVRGRRTTAYLQSCQASIQHLLIGFTSGLATVEQRYITPGVDSTVSIIEMHTEIEKLAKPGVHMSKIVTSADSRLRSFPFAMLDALYEAVCAAQMSEAPEIFRTLASVLLAGLKTYLNPVGAWMQTGRLPAKDGTFLVTENNASCGLNEFWQSRYILRGLPNGLPSTPAFMQRYARKIFALGKSRAFLLALNNGDESDITDTNSPMLNFVPLEEMLSSISLFPFSQMLDDVLEAWISETGKDCTSLLCDNLLREQGLLQTISGLNQTFCSLDGRLFQAFADTLFWRMDMGRDNWKDAFLITELAQTTVGSANPVNANSLSVHFTDEEDDVPAESSVRELEKMTLEINFPWPIQNIMGSNLPSAYSKTFTLLLQTYRAQYLIRQEYLDLRLLNSRRNAFPSVIAAALSLRQRLLTILDIFHAHLVHTADVLGSAVRTQIEAAGDIDSMSSIWTEHHQHMEMSLLVADNLKPVREAVIGVLELCERLTNFWRGLIGVYSKDSDSSEADDGEDQDDHDENPSLEVAPISALQSELEKTVLFIKAGLRGISRAGGNRPLEALAERLEWSVH